jgi:23S rRNA pseudouridine1911/1915/1917 synthase
MPPDDPALSAPGGVRVPAALAGERVDRVVALLTGRPRRQVDDLIGAGEVRLGGRVVTSRSVKVRAGDSLWVAETAVASPAGLSPDPSVDVTVVWEDADVVVVDKPAGLVVHPGAGNRGGTLVQGILARYPEVASLGTLPGAADRPGVVHRLDKGTSGLLVVARTAAAHADLVAQMQGRSVERRYAALVGGTVADDAGMVDAPLGRSERDPTRITVRTGGRPARTRYRVQRRYADPVAATLLTCTLETGRTHQIRVHLAAIGHPVVGDRRYGGSPGGLRSRPGSAGGLRSRPGSDEWAPLPPDRPWLHAEALAFRHPRSGQPLSFSAPLPPDLRAVLEKLA